MLYQGHPTDKPQRMVCPLVVVEDKAILAMKYTNKMTGTYLPN
jgi:hypothetical protein